MMTIRRLWLFGLISISLSSILIYGLIMTSLTDRSFKTYMNESYENHIGQVLNYTQKALTESNTSYSQMGMELETHVVDPITRIKLYDREGKLLVDVSNEESSNITMMNSRIMSRMMQNQTEMYPLEIDQYKIEEEGNWIATLNITRQSSIENGFVVRMFKVNLLKNSFIAIGISVFLALISGIIISKYMSRRLIETADIAKSLLVDENQVFSPSSIREINDIRESLDELRMRLKLKQRTRKTFVEQLVHQTRTPLTVLKSHLEGIEDQMITLDHLEYELLKLQIEDVSKMIENMNSIVDVEETEINISIETIEVHALLYQIIMGLKAQFDQKNLHLQLVDTGECLIESDRHILSQILYNLLLNAYKYTLEDGTITVSFEKRATVLEISIKDEGIGIAKTEQKKIFDAYYRVPRSVQISGDGLGLYFVSENLKRLNGHISVNSDIGCGSEFIVTLPVKQ